MGTARSLFFTITSIFITLAGAGSFACLFFITANRLDAPDSSLPLVFVTAALMLIYSVINIVSGINGMRSHNKRINSAVVIRLPEISVGICLITIIVSLINGIMFGYLAVMIVTGVIVPLLFIWAAARKSSL